MNTGGIRKLATAALTATLALPAMWGTTAGAEGASGGTTLGGQRAARVDVGDSHACAVADDGEVYCWGYNWAGQGGNGTTTDDESSLPSSGESNGPAGCKLGAAGSVRFSATAPPANSTTHAAVPATITLRRRTWRTRRVTCP